MNCFGNCRYNGFIVEIIGKVEKIPGGYVRRVRIVNAPAWVIDREFNAVCDHEGNIAD